MDLASKGNNRDVDVFSDEVFDPSNASEGDEGVYKISSKTDYPGLVFCFGKAIGRGLGLILSSVVLCSCGDEIICHLSD